MRLINRSQYDTRALRRIITKVHQVMTRTEGRLSTWRSLRITVETRRARWNDGAVSGWATLDGGRMMLRLPNPKRHHISAHRVAWLVEHELYHSYGHDHRHFAEESPEWWGQHVGTQDVPLRQKTRRAPRDLRGERAEKARRLLRTWERRLKLAQTKVRQYRKKVRYYQRTAAARSAIRTSTHAGGAGEESPR